MEQYHQRHSVSAWQASHQPEDFLFSPQHWSGKIQRHRILLARAWLENGLCSRQRKHTTPQNASNLSDIQLVIRFILQYAEDHAILLPGRVQGYKRDDMLLLPSSVKKKEVWELYRDATKPISDLCWTCQ